MNRQATNNYHGYEAVIGLEVHAELQTASKMFCSCPNDPFAAEPNANVCPICLGMPGTLPVPNKKAVELTLKVGRALHCTIAEESKFDRKHYFYPDLPKGYQISQYDQPLAQGGYLEVEGTKVRIRRVHLEEDTGKNIHPPGEGRRAAYSLVDYNRAGVPLIELVTEPDITSATMASAFAKELQRILRSQGASSADMEKGHLRVEANVSVRQRGDQSSGLGTKVEIKNLNSFRSVEKAIEYEIRRQIQLLERGERVEQETRGWDEEKEVTFPQRTKEEAEDYRYFPEPDIPPLLVADWQVERAELPEERRRRYRDRYGLSDKLASLLVADQHLADLFERVVSKVGSLPPPQVANWLVNEGVPPTVDAERLAELLQGVGEGRLTATLAKEAIKRAKETGRLEVPQGVQVIFDHGRLATIIDEVIAGHPAAVSDVKAGKMQALGFLVGQVMAKTSGRADPKTVNDLLRAKLL